MLLDEIRVFKIKHMPKEQLRLRLGAHTGMEVGLRVQY